MAAARGHTQVVQFLVGCGATTTLRNHENETLAEVAEAASHVQLAAWLTEHEGESPLMIAVKSCMPAALRLAAKTTDWHMSPVPQGTGRSRRMHYSPYSNHCRMQYQGLAAACLCVQNADQNPKAYRTTLTLATTIETLGWTCWDVESHWLHPPRARAAVSTILRIAERFCRLESDAMDAEEAEAEAEAEARKEKRSPKRKQPQKPLVVPALPNELWVTLILPHLSVFDWLGEAWEDPRLTAPGVPNLLAGDAPSPRKLN